VGGSAGRYVEELLREDTKLGESMTASEHNLASQVLARMIRQPSAMGLDPRAYKEVGLHMVSGRS